MKFSLLLVALLCAATVFAQTPKVAHGSVQRFENFPSQYIQPRNVDVWLPEGYDAANKYAVLYMHDGQMLFDSTTTWNHQEWKVDESLSKLLAEKRIKNCIVVGIWNNGEYRHSEYFPQKPIAFLPPAIRDSLVKNELRGKPQADNYLLFLTKELKPKIDSAFSTLPDAANTFIAGSSMGGLISFYAICEYPNIFSGAACLSTHWVGSIKQPAGFIPKAFNKYAAKHLPSPDNHKIYFDYGNKTLDSLYKPHQLVIDQTMQKNGYDAKQWITKEFLNEDHSEKAWSKRLYIPFLFLLKEEQKGKR